MVAEVFPLRGECIRVLDSGSITILLGLPEVDRPQREQKRTFQAVYKFRGTTLAMDLQVTTVKRHGNKYRFKSTSLIQQTPILQKQACGLTDARQPQFQEVRRQ